MDLVKSFRTASRGPCFLTGIPMIITSPYLSLKNRIFDIHMYNTHPNKNTEMGWVSPDLLNMCLFNGLEFL